MPFFALSLFSSALLLFLLQPMVGKIILPSLGGTPAVWNTCMVFFQVTLLAGYAYAHCSVTLLGVRRQSLVHIVVVSLALLALPIGVSMDGVPTASDNPGWWLLGRLAVGVGLPFLILSMNGPLLQRWFAATRHPSAKDPYFLYGASNVGSLIGLLGYPLLVEQHAGLAEQSWIWGVGYFLLSGMVLACALLTWRIPDESAAVDSALDEGELEGETASVNWVRRLRWIALAFVPSSLMLGATTHITTDIAPVPLLWVVPLALYLLTFVFVFARRPVLPHVRVMQVLPFVVVPVGLLTVTGGSNLGWVVVLAHLLLMFLAGLAYHGELVRDRPPARLLTGFYWWMSVGGALGGVFNALVAPFLFSSILEYPLAMVLVCVVFHRHSQSMKRWSRWLLDLAAPVTIGAATVGLLHALGVGGEWSEHGKLLLVVAIPSGLCLLFVGRPLRFGLSLGAAMIAMSFGPEAGKEHILLQTRNFFGVKLVTINPSGFYNVFEHGCTIHGIQDRRAPRRRTSLAYFHKTGPIGNVFQVFESAPTSRRIAIVGLGAGSLATYARPGQEIDFYEIDPEVVRIAEEPKYFSFLKDCRGRVSVILGDGRLSIAEKPNAHYGFIALDAFSSDAVPTHLLTREALRLYLDKLDDGGLLVFNISNRYLDLAPLLAALAEDAGVECLFRRDDVSPEEYATGKMSSQFIVMARTEGDLRRLKLYEGWVEPQPKPGVPVWTDQYSNILSVVDYR